MNKSKKLEALHYWVLQGLFIAGYLFHQTEEWDSRPLALCSMLALLLFVMVPKLGHLIFFSLLAFGCYVNLNRFPNLSNHSNITLFISLFLLPYQFLLTFNYKKINYESLLNTLRISVLIVYFFTIFHKLNWDFLNPEISCANRKLEDYFFMIPESIRTIEPLLKKLMPYFGLAIEGAIPLFLFFKTTRGFGLITLVILHFTLAPMGFTDFSSFAMCLAWSFIDPEKLDVKTLKRDFKYLAYGILAMSFGFGLTRYKEQIETYAFAEGIVFAIIYSVFIWRHFLGKHSRDSLFVPPKKLQILFVSLFFIFGFSNYLGLRTAGTFSMFSNLTTEGEKSNHILLGSNPFKFFSYQEDIIEILAVDHSVAGFSRKMPEVGQKIPRIAFSRILAKINRNNWRNVTMTIKYKGETRQTESAGFDRQFDLHVPYWQKKIFKFRHIQAKGPQQCWW